MLRLVFVLLTATASLAADKPHVIFLFADDMRADSIAALGNPDVKTPHLDTIVNRGFKFTNAYCAGGNSGAVCTPSRNMLLTGNHYLRWKDFTPPNGRKGSIAPGDGVNLPTTFQALGYYTYHHGKKGNTAPLVQAKFDTNLYLANDEKDRTGGEPGQEIVDAAIKFWTDRTDTKPVLMYLAFGNPHDPRVAADHYLRQYDAATLTLPKNIKPFHAFDNGDLLVRDEKLLPWPRTDADLRRTWRDYYATVTAMDHHIGRLLAVLKAKGHLDNTLIVFSADQGIALGSHGLLGKQNLYDAGMKVPLVFAGPGVPKGSSDGMAYLFDVFPTLADLAGKLQVNQIDGRSLAGVIRGTPGPAPRSAIYLSYLDVQRGIVADGWKLLRYPKVDVTQLFHLATDPDETADVSAKEPDRVKTMLALLAKEQARYSDALPLTVATPKPAAVTAEGLTAAAKKK
jgi:arylsulfatase A-like enzyme